MKFLDDQVNEAFMRDGFVKIKLLESTEIQSLLGYANEELLSKEISNSDYGMYVSLEEDHDLKMKTMEFVRSNVANKLAVHISDFQIYLGGYLIKAPDGTKYTFPHQDWTFVDNETSNWSATVWISLLDLDESNGTLGFLKGSHQFINFPVGSPSPAVPTPIMGMENDIFPYLEFISIKAGEAFVFNNKTIHAANPNSGDFYRIAAGIGITQSMGSLYHYYLNPNKESEFIKLKVQEEFFMNYNNDDLHELYLKKEVPGLCEVVGYVPCNKHDFPSTEQILLNAAAFQNIKTGNQIDFNKHYGRPDEEVKEPEPMFAETPEYIDTRSFFEKYTPINIYREAKHRIGTKFVK